MSRNTKKQVTVKTGVSWPDVWQWADSVRDTWGYNAVFKVCQPLQTQKGLTAVVVLELTKLRITDPQMNSSIKRWRNVPEKGATVEDIALQLLVEVDAGLDREAWSAERAALDSGALL